MKTISFAALIAVAAATFSHADSVKCSSADGALQYSLSQEIPGGAPPPIGRASYGPTIKWFVNGQERASGAATLAIPGPDQILHDTKINSEIVEVYWTTASLGGRNYYVLCESRRYTGPLPPAAAHR